MDIENQDIEAWIEDQALEQTPKRLLMEPDASEGSESGQKRRRLQDPTVLNRRLTLVRPSSQEDLSERSSRSRKSSPVRSAADLESAVPPIKKCEINPANEAELPEDVRQLRKRVKAYKNLRGVLPSCIKSEITSVLGSDFDDPFYISTSSDKRTRETWLRYWEEIQFIRESAQLCSDEDKPEPSWGEEVVRPLLNLGVKYWRTGKETPCPVTVRAENLTTATISPPHIAPKDARGNPLEFKKVDYGMFLVLDPDGSKLVKGKLQWLDPTEKSVNLTMAGYVRNKPLVMFMELKKANSESDPVVQLGICASALLRRLTLLSRTKLMDLLPLPVLQVVGHDWKVYYLHYADCGDVMLRGPDRIGSTLESESIFQIIRVLGVVADYAVDEYWPWYKESIL